MLLGLQFDLETRSEAHFDWMLDVEGLLAKKKKDYQVKMKPLFFCSTQTNSG